MHGPDLRTPQEEHIMQGDWTPEQVALYRVRKGYWQEINYAQKQAYALLGHLRAIEEEKGWKVALKFSAETEYWQSRIVLMGVVPTHRDYCLRLFQAVAFERFKGHVDALTQGR